MPKGNFQTKGGFNPRNTTPTTATTLMNVSWDVFKLTPKQVTKLVPVANAANEYQLETMPTGGGPGGQIPPAKIAAANEKLAKALTDILTPDQVNRVEQVRYQLIALGSGYLTNAEVAKALALKEEQKATITSVLSDAQRLSAAAQGPLGGFNSFGTLAWLPKLNEKVTARAMAVLTDEQKATWKKVTGEPVPNLRPISPFGLPGGIGGWFFPGGV